jgi:hypothetical protein
MRIDHRLLFHHKPQPVALAYCDKLCAALGGCPLRERFDRLMAELLGRLFTR